MCNSCIGKEGHSDYYTPANKVLGIYRNHPVLLSILLQSTTHLKPLLKVYDLRICMKEDYCGLKNIKADNNLYGTVVSFVIWLTILVKNYNHDIYHECKCPNGEHIFNKSLLCKVHLLILLQMYPFSNANETNLV